MAAPDVQEGLNYSQMAGYAVRALGSLEEANKRNQQVLSLVDEYNKK